MEASMKKMLYVLLMLGWIPTLAVVIGTWWNTGQAVAAQGNTPRKVTGVYNGGDGKTKVEALENPVEAWGPRQRCIGIGCTHYSASAADKSELFSGLAPGVTPTARCDIERRKRG